MSDNSPEPPLGFAAGSRIAGYRLDEQIGLGGMAVVFRAHDERLDRQVALKILVPAMAADVAFRQRFIRESRAAAAVDDPHIIPVFEAGEARGVLFIAMRLVRGGDMRSLVRRIGALPPARVAEIVSQVASALDAAHARGLVHRDVKPGNILLGVIESRGRPDHVYLSDFGLSKGSLEISGLTGAGQFMGTLDYISPEQIEGRPVDGRADQYALACTAFELLSGVPPFARDEAMAVMYAQLSEPPPAVTSRRPGLPAAADAVFARALAKRPADRFASCRDFADALGDALGPPRARSGASTLAPSFRPRTEVVVPSPTGAGPPAPASGPPASRPPASGPPVAAPWAKAAGTGTQGWSGYDSQPGAGADSWYGARRVPEPGPGHGPGPAPIPAGSDMSTILPGQGRRVTVPGLTEEGGTPAGWPGRRSSGQGDWAGQPPGVEYVTGRLHRSRWPAVVGASVLVLAAAGGTVGFLATRHNAPRPQATQGARQTGSTPNAATLAALKPPSCGAAIGPGRSSAIRPAGLLTVPAPPYGAITTADLGYTFIALPTGIEVLRNRAGIPVNPPVRTIPIPDHPHAQALTSNGRYLLTATDHGVTVISVSAAERPGAGNPIAGELPSGLPGNPGGDDLALSVNDRFVFVALRYANKIAVFDLAKALRTRFKAGHVVGYARVGIKPHGMAVSADGRWLYVTSRFARPGTLEGTLSVLSVRAAETHPARALVSSAIAGCGAYRVIASPDGSVLWVIAQSSNYLVGFSAAKLRSDPRHALIAKVPIGAIPLDEVLVNGGTRILVTDNAGADLAVVDPAAALAGRKRALVGYVRTSALPRFFAFEPDGPVVLLVTGDRSDQIQAIKTDDLP